MKHLIPLVLIIIFSGCGRKESTNSSEKVNTADIKALVIKALNSDTAANDKYNSIIADSLIAGKKVYFFVLLENQEPLYNRFAVYDSILTPLLIDKSLNGNIYFEKFVSGGKQFIRIDDIYQAKDTLLLNRLSLYSPDLYGFYLVFRTHTKFAKPGTEYFQDIIEVSDTLIKTKIGGTGRFTLVNKEDVFKYTSSEMKYLSPQNLFDEFIKKEIENFEYTTVKKQLTK
jgi:hypothetical protein